ncbi:hypothetical protein F8154_08010 [Alkaliphilus pronyensis]|uniref:Uncharacterized protein n=1 Tax=Alkaliphilus pronyensis TaxID=1482732 RepID=A0A6I0F949_9FIRM|nr:hypothetical protein [Alkaliphilus pronyensis]KAB3534796.1 hypothetical protein F8154_08010 [Alkaliphilus pronyensis]
MKKIFIVILTIFCLISLLGCEAASNKPIENDTISENLTKGNPYVYDIGGPVSEYSDPYVLIYYGVDTFLFDIAGREKVEEWVSQFESLENPKGRDVSELTIVNAVKELDVSREAFEEAGKWTYTKEQIEAIYSNDQKLINKAFVNEFALLVNDKIYTSRWLATHTMEDYKKEGITEDLLKEYLNKIKETPLAEDHNKIYNKLDSSK